MEKLSIIITWAKDNPKTVIFIAGVAAALAVKYIF
jgi:hypothetical protein